ASRQTGPGAYRSDRRGWRPVEVVPCTARGSLRRPPAL
ncbi:MAG: hypothetical protein AVDCRST_MAG88-2553, partial [uncultured Thermomicrobiales bacterium]